MSFDRLASHYRWMEFVLAGEKLQRCRTAFLDQIANHQNILLMGEGNGRFLSELVTVNPSARITYIDASQKMLRCAQASLARKNLPTDRVEFLCADLSISKLPKKRSDAVVSHFFLDCFTQNQLRSLILRIAESTQPEAIWLISDFCEAPHGFKKWRSRAILWIMYRFFRWTTKLPATRLVSPDLPLRENGFQLRQRRFFDWNLLHTDLWQHAGLNAESGAIERV